MRVKRSPSVGAKTVGPAPLLTTSRIPQRRGLTSVLAMLYLVLFGTLAIGFYAATNTQSQIVANDERVARAHLACESGMDFMRYQLGRVHIAPGTPTDQVIDELEQDLRSQLEDTANLAGQPILRNGNTLMIPGNAGWVGLDDAGNSRFRATITDWAGEIVVKIDGMNGGMQANRAITMDFTRATHPTSIFNYAIASKGQVVMLKGAVTTVTGVDPSIATVMSALAGDPAISVSGGVIGGELNITEDGVARVTGGSVAGETDTSVILNEHVNTVEKPEFPAINTEIYEQYATNVYAPGVRTQQNIRIPPNTNPRFNGGDTVQGIMYIESPNIVTFRGNFNLQGFIVFENSGDTSLNALDFRGNVTQSPLPAGTQFDALRATSGVAILGPTAAVTMSGSTDSYLRGNVIIGSFHFKGSADIQIDQGTLMTYNEEPGACVFDGKTVKFHSTGHNNMPTTGITYSTYYEPDPESYQEVTP
jgi:hypothetical protein